ncbi:TPA: hypothetical protein DD449_03555 [Candidatus Berkelbacteria bacterium]|uniref:Uncharacterized protein n=1 Tax=Berkelbacteria bacterium GW2011_GWE1_39_12 TaxID=1618337 RepID=A0A0G4B571_9BACT|nr:MAG: hypothetical protein UT28_C0001G0343 [Berkelbacteria bacterium GW2011_GWE1_39_12]HBO60734.1 hypothetical protein [Candidatus Berkelbacteria bacterium]
MNNQTDQILTQQPISTPPVKKPTSSTAVVLIIIGSIIGVMIIIGILSVMVTASLGGAKDKAKDVKIKSDVHQLRAMAETYYSDNKDSYTGWKPDQGILSDLANQKSTLQFVAKDQKIALFAKLTTDNNYYCSDEIHSIVVSEVTLDKGCPLPVIN